jgi:hypothetical protein
MRTYKVGKTRGRKPKVTLYQNGQVMLCQPVRSVAVGNQLGRAWADSEAVRDGQ